MKDKRNTPKRTKRTFFQALVGTAASWVLVQEVAVNAFPFLQSGEWKTAVISGVAVVLTALASTATNFVENKQPARKTSGTMEDS